MATGYTGYTGYGTAPNPQQAQTLLANALINEGTDASPIRSGWQGAARLAQTLVGAMLNNRQLAAQKAAIDQGGSLLTGLTGGGAGAAPSPGAGPLMTPPGSGAPASAPAPGGPSASLPAGYDPAAVKQMAPQIFAANGIDPNVGMKVLGSEGLNSYVGDNGSSFGPGQLHYGGVAPGGNAVPGLGDEFTKATGLDARDPSTVPQQLQFIAQQAAKGGWGPWHGAANSGIGPWDGIQRPGMGAQPMAGSQPAQGWNGQGMPPPPPQGQSAAAGAPAAAAPAGALAFAGPQGAPNPAQAAIAANVAPPGSNVAPPMPPVSAPPPQMVAGGPGPGAPNMPPQGAMPRPQMPQAAPAMPPGVPPMQGTPQANPAIIRQAYAVMSNPYADPAIKEMAANILNQQISLSMPQPYTWKDIPGTNNQQAFDRYGRPVQGMVIQGGPQKLGPGDSLYNVGTPGIPGAPGGSGAPGAAPGVSMVPGTGGTDYYAKKAAAEETAKLQAQQATPSAQTYQEFQGKLKEGQGYKEYSMALPTWNSMLVHAQQNSPPADKAMVDDMAKILNPGRAVGMGQFAVNSDIQSVPEELRGYAAKMLSGDASIRAQARAQMLAAAQAKVTEYKSAWDTDANQNKRIAQKFGYDPDLAIPQLPDMAPYDATKGLGAGPVPVPGVGGMPPGGIQLPLAGQAPGAPPAASAVPNGAPPQQGGDMLGAARAAIAKGAPRAAVEQRLRTLGIDPAGL